LSFGDAAAVAAAAAVCDSGCGCIIDEAQLQAAALTDAKQKQANQSILLEVQINSPVKHCQGVKCFTAYW